MAEQNFDYDWLVIGSGFGGSVSALRLAEKGYKVGVLERGRRYRDEDFAKSSWNLRKYIWAPILGLRGVFRLTPFKDVFIASGSGVGGGSLVYANTLYRAAPEFFTHPQWAGLEDWAAALRPHYDTAERMLGVQTVPFDSDSQKLLKGVGAAFGVGRHVPSYAVRSLLRRARQDSARSLLRRGRARPHRLHPLRRLHDRMPRRREEHVDEELPVVRGEEGGGDHPRATSSRHPAARRGRWLGRLPCHDRAPRRVAAQAAPAVHRAQRDRVGGRDGDQSTPRPLQAHRVAAADQRPPGLAGANQQRVDPCRQAAGEH